LSIGVVEIFINLTPLIPLSMIWIYIPIMRGRYYIKRGFASLKLSYLPEILGEFRGALAPLKTNLPLPLGKGKGIQGIGLINNLIW